MAGPALAVIRSSAPTRICDIGGWTDTWFARHGRVLNIAVSPLAQVELQVHPLGAAEPAERVRLRAADFADRYAVVAPGPPWGPHPLLEAAIASMAIPKDVRLEIDVRCDAPAGAGTGTSAAVTVALIGALDILTPGRLTPREVAAAAHQVETERLQRQCGIQDQIASACGGISFIEMDEYPHATVSPVVVEDSTWAELERRLVLVSLGRAHDSSALHETVIRSLESAGPEAPVLDALRGAALRARDAIASGDLAGLGRAMTECTEAQGRLHPALVGPDARRVIEIARAHAALGWKVNGAGGEGGSLTLLSDADPSREHALVRELEAASPRFRRVPMRLSRDGLRVWRAPAAATGAVGA